MINQKDFEAILADVHRRAEVLRAEVHHMKRLKEQLLNEKTRCLSQIKDVAQGNRLNFLKFYPKVGRENFMVKYRNYGVKLKLIRLKRGSCVDRSMGGKDCE